MIPKMKHIVIAVICIALAFIIFKGCVMVYKSRGVDINHELKSPGIEVEVNKDTIR